MARSLFRNDRGDVSLILIVLIVVLVLGSGTYLFLKKDNTTNQEASPTPTYALTPTSTSTNPSPTTAVEWKTYSFETMSFQYPSSWHPADGTMTGASFATIYSYPEDKTDPARTYDTLHAAAPGELKLVLKSFDKKSNIDLESWLRNEVDDYTYFPNRKYDNIKIADFDVVTALEVYQNGSSIPTYVLQSAAKNKAYMLYFSYDDNNKWQDTINQILNSVIV